MSRRKVHRLALAYVFAALAAWAASATGAVGPTGAAYAHHSIATTYDEERPIVLEGIVARFAFVNPHPIVMMNVEKAGGRPQVWRLEMDNRYELTDAGFAQDTFKAGDRLVVTGSPARTIPHSLYVRKIARPADGFVYEHAPY